MTYGLDLQREKLEQNGTEYQFGALSTPCLASFPSSQRAKYLPPGELQNIGEEKSGCVTRAYVNILSTKFTYLLRNNLLLPAHEQWFRKNGYIVIFPNGLEGIDFSDAYIEIKSGTTRQGNSMKAPAQAIHEWGLVPKTLLPQLDSFDDHMNPKRITPEIETLGKEFLARFVINYEQVPKVLFSAALDDDMLAFAGYAWPNPINGEYPKTDFPFNHCFMGFFKPLYFIFDNYLDTDGDFIKKLASDYNLYEYAYRIFITKQNNPNNIKTPAEAFNWLKWLFSLLAIKWPS